jgi:hypothetical protein
MGPLDEAETAVGRFAHNRGGPQLDQAGGESAGERSPSAVFQARIHEILTGVVAELERLTDDVEERSADRSEVDS